MALRLSCEVFLHDARQAALRAVGRISSGLFSRHVGIIRHLLCRHYYSIIMDYYYPIIILCRNCRQNSLQDILPTCRFNSHSQFSNITISTPWRSVLLIDEAYLSTLLQTRVCIVSLLGARVRSTTSGIYSRNCFIWICPESRNLHTDKMWVIFWATTSG